MMRRNKGDRPFIIALIISKLGALMAFLYWYFFLL
jgi:hypothetical protein